MNFSICRTGGGHPDVKYTKGRGIEPNRSSSITLFSKVVKLQASLRAMTCYTLNLRNQDIKVNGKNHLIF